MFYHFKYYQTLALQQCALHVVFELFAMDIIDMLVAQLNNNTHPHFEFLFSLLDLFILHPLCLGVLYNLGYQLYVETQHLRLDLSCCVF